MLAFGLQSGPSFAGPILLVYVKESTAQLGAKEEQQADMHAHDAWPFCQSESF